MTDNMNADQTVMNDQAAQSACADPLAKRISAELKATDNKKNSPLKQLSTLLISLVLFVSLGLFNGSMRGIFVLVVVIFIHEMGHLIGMRLMKYKDVQMFFIPLFGAAVSGNAVMPSGVKKATVSLLGPVPGILLGLVAGGIYIKTQNPWLSEFTRAFLFINTFNLLPFHPLDGGRFFDAILFSRHPVLEVVFKTLTTLALGGIAWVLKAPILGIFSIMILLTLKTTYSTAKIANDFKKKYCGREFPLDQDMPVECIHELIPFVKKMIPDTVQPTPKVLSGHILGIWQRIQNRPSRLSSSIGMIIAYLAFMLMGISSFLFFSGVSYVLDGMNKEIIMRTTADGVEQRYELTMMGTNRFQEFQINEENLFHGTQIDWYLTSTNISKTGQWKNGYRDGEFFLYDENGEKNRIILYDNGTPVRYQVLINDEFVDIPKDEWSADRRYIKIQDEPIKADASTP